MKCHICDALLSQPRYNKEIKAWEPCETCMEIIFELLDDFKDNAVFVDESEGVALKEAGIPQQNFEISG